MRRQAAINMVTNRLNYAHVRWRGLFVLMRSTFEKPVCIISILFGLSGIRASGLSVWTGNSASLVQSEISLLL